ncbi:uncharacterized protein LOC128545990 [Mercenaria mercenaria]|uniref:uncharacterized protein LOC128545990 n=1 Tax=Mercenaria mercenaria TaxID=6596 RepID=UPI00234EB91B|nr:uncharacterized protein LOC128545990 [Mercenaria mercenaria]
MESVSGEKGVKELLEEGTPIEYLEGDGDNTLIARLKSNLNLTMKKRFDRNHVVKNIGKRLYMLHGEKGVKLSKNVIVHIQKCLKYVFAKNQSDDTGMKENLRAIIPHQFGDHSLCQPRFCGYKRKPGSLYSHRSLPYKAPLKDNNLRSRLESIFQPIISNAEQYSDLGSSQQCEHANREVHYSAHTKAGLSPGVHTIRYAEKCAKSRKRSSDLSQLPSTKRRRLILKQERATTQGAQEALEGVSYQSGIGHEQDIDIEKIPDAVPRGDFKLVTYIQHDKPTLVMVDLETTDLIRGSIIPHITQISAVDYDSGDTFDQYVVPKMPITTTAQQVTGIVICGSNLTVNGSPVQSLPIKETLERFLFHREKARNIRSLDVLISSSVCKAATAKNIAGSGLNLSRLQRIYSRDGEDGLQNTFTVKNSEGQPRVTSSKRVLETVIPKLADFLKKRE